MSLWSLCLSFLNVMIAGLGYYIQHLCAANTQVNVSIVRKSPSFVRMRSMKGLKELDSLSVLWIYTVLVGSYFSCSPSASLQCLWLFVLLPAPLPASPCLATSLLSVLLPLILGVLFQLLSAARPHLSHVKIACVHTLSILLSAVCIKCRECPLLSLLYSMISCLGGGDSIRLM